MGIRSSIDIWDRCLCMLTQQYFSHLSVITTMAGLNFIQHCVLYSMYTRKESCPKPLVIRTPSCIKMYVPRNQGIIQVRSLSYQHKVKDLQPEEKRDLV